MGFRTLERSARMVQSSSNVAKAFVCSIPTESLIWKPTRGYGTTSPASTIPDWSRWRKLNMHGCRDITRSSGGSAIPHEPPGQGAGRLPVAPHRHTGDDRGVVTDGALKQPLPARRQVISDLRDAELEAVVVDDVDVGLEPGRLAPGTTLPA